MKMNAHKNLNINLNICVKSLNVIKDMFFSSLRCTLSHQPRTATVFLKKVLDNRLPHKTIKELVKPGNFIYLFKSAFTVLS